MSLMTDRSWSDGQRLAAAATVICLLLVAQHAPAGQIGPDAFTSAASVQDFETLYGGTTSYTAPLVVGGDTYDSDDHALKSSGKFGPLIGRSGVAISHLVEAGDPGDAFIDITLAYPVLRAGLYVGYEFAWTAEAQFYNASDTLLGTISLSGGGDDSSFAAWQTDDGLIAHVRVVDQGGSHNQLIIDDLVREVPEPASILSVSIAVVILLGARSRGPDYSAT